MKRTFLPLALLTLSSASGGFAALYDNTAIDTRHTLLYSVGPYNGIGDQIQLGGPGVGWFAKVQLFNEGGPGTFDAELRFYEVGAPVGAQIGGTFTLANVTAPASDIIDLTFFLDSLLLPDNLIFVVTVDKPSIGTDLGLTLFQPPTVGFSDETFLVVDTGSFSTEVSSDENVYFQLTPVPEPSTIVLLGLGLVAVLIRRGRI